MEETVPGPGFPERGERLLEGSAGAFASRVRGDPAERLLQGAPDDVEPRLLLVGELRIVQGLQAADAGHAAPRADSNSAVITAIPP